MASAASKGGFDMVKQTSSARRLLVAANLRRLIKADPAIRTLAAFSELHGSDIRTVKRWCRDGVESLSTVAEIAKTLGVSDLALILDASES